MAKRVHKMGKQYGYETDGESYWLAPGLKEMLDAVLDERTALYDLLTRNQEYVNVRLTASLRRQRAAWARIFDELGITRGSGELYSYSAGDGRIYPTGARQQPEQSPAEEEDA